MESAFESNSPGLTPRAAESLEDLYSHLGKRFVKATLYGDGFEVSPTGTTIITPDQIHAAFEVSLRFNVETGLVTLQKDGVAVVFSPSGPVTVDGVPITPEALAIMSETSDPTLQSFVRLLQAQVQLDLQGKPTLVVSMPEATPDSNPAQP